MAFQLRTVFLFCLWDLQYAAPTGPALSIRTVQFSMRWEDAGGRHAQAVAITLANLSLGSLGSLPNTSIQSKYLVELISESGFRCAHGVGNSTVLIKDSDGNVVGTSSGWPITLLRQSWTADESILSTHEPPTWVNLPQPHHVTVLTYPSFDQSGLERNADRCEWEATRYCIDWIINSQQRPQGSL